jgi:hypothetical protein
MTSAAAAKVGDELPPFVRTTGFDNWNRYAAVNDEFVPIHMDDDAGRAAVGAKKRPLASSPSVSRLPPASTEAPLTVASLTWRSIFASAWSASAAVASATWPISSPVAGRRGEGHPPRPDAPPCRAAGDDEVVVLTW